MKNTYIVRMLSAISFVVILAAPVMAQTSPTVKGFIKLTGSGSEGKPTAMTVTNVRARVSGDVDDKTSYTFFVDMVKDEVLLDAAISHVVLPTVTVTAGQFKSPYSTDNLMAATVYPFINRGYLKSKVTPSFRDIGVQVTHKKGILELTAALMNGAGANKTETDTGKSTIGRAVVTVTPWMSLSGNYGHGVDSTDGSDIDFIDAGVDGVLGIMTYAGEFAGKSQNSTTSQVGAAWLTLDCKTGGTRIPVLTPAVKCEMYDPDTDADDDRITRFTAGFSVHLTALNKNRIMLNYEYTDYESANKDSEGRGSIEYMIKF